MSCTGDTASKLACSSGLFRKFQGCCLHFERACIRALQIPFVVSHPAVVLLHLSRASLGSACYAMCGCSTMSGLVAQGTCGRGWNMMKKAQSSEGTQHSRKSGTQEVYGKELMV